MHCACGACISRRAPKIESFFESRESLNRWGFACHSLVPIHAGGGCWIRTRCAMFWSTGAVRIGRSKLSHARRLLGSQSPGPIGVGCHLSIPSPVRWRNDAWVARVSHTCLIRGEPLNVLTGSDSTMIQLHISWKPKLQHIMSAARKVTGVK